MSDIAVTPQTFDIGDLFTGKVYPKEVIEVYLDETTALAIQRNAQAITKAVVAEDDAKIKELEETHHELIRKGAASKIKVYLTGVSRRERKAIVDKVLADHPQEYNFLGQPKPNPEADEAHANLRWALHIEKIERPDGSALNAPSAADIKIFRENAPDDAIEQIEDAIVDLAEGVKGGFETIVQEHDFLSQP